MQEIAGVLSDEKRYEQMAIAIEKIPLMPKRLNFTNNRVSIVCYGPSLKYTWPQIRGKVISVSGAHDFLVDKGICPTWHVDCDPRQHKVSMLNSPAVTTKYLMASVCHPDWWEKLLNHDVHLWHLINGNDFQTLRWLHAHQPKGVSRALGGGSTVGQRAMNVASMLGYRKFDMYGMDLCLDGKDHHAGPHPNNKQIEVKVKVDGKVFETTPQMVQAALELKTFLRKTDVDVVFHGDGLIQRMAELIKEKT